MSDVPDWLKTFLIEKRFPLSEWDGLDDDQKLEWVRWAEIAYSEDLERWQSELCDLEQNIADTETEIEAVEMHPRYIEQSKLRLLQKMGKCFC